jgi:hypothetical protein
MSRAQCLRFHLSSALGRRSYSNTVSFGQTSRSFASVSALAVVRWSRNSVKFVALGGAADQGSGSDEEYMAGSTNRARFRFGR